MVSVPGTALAGMAIVSCIVSESLRGLEKSRVCAHHGTRRIQAERADLDGGLAHYRNDDGFAKDRRASEKGLSTFTSGGGRFPVAMTEGCPRRTNSRRRRSPGR